MFARHQTNLGYQGQCITTNLKNIMLMKVISHKSTHLVWFHLYEMSSIGQFMETESRFMVPKARRQENGKWLLIGLGFCFVLFWVVEMF